MLSRRLATRALRTAAALVFSTGAVATARAQEAPPAAPPVSGGAEKTVAETASPELVGQLVSELGVTPKQAEGGAGTLLGVAKSRLAAADFAKVAAAVPNIDGLLKAAPAAGALGQLSGGAGTLGGMAAAASTLSKLGIKPETVARFAPALVKAVQSKGGAEVGALLAGALK